ncbi:hypothetical protein [Sinimarinibacterium sp. NLF-5-8]|uniref:hypothetical protein n=1 Tax=Sinimarinibacterium sp. NLF-5-8 TaxID=2698684 RepID=UPI00137C1134|nr:hypothetical protein [Sinimarinibacterium sp. NLF-5-8]QHS10315.1 hypothetical protein GT972_09320 [Sinimarinibacterium sp. NLF-5-8]
MTLTRAHIGRRVLAGLLLLSPRLFAAQCVPDPALVVGCEGCHHAGAAGAAPMSDLSAIDSEKMRARLLQLRQSDDAALLMPRLLKGLSDADLARLVAHYACTPR